MPKPPHIPVLVQEVLSLLLPDGRDKGAHRIIDATVGAGGHSMALLGAGASQLLGLDRDESALLLAAQRLQHFAPRFQLRHHNFSNLDLAAKQIGWNAVDAILFDLGLSSMQLASAERGFSLMHDGPLDMRFDRSEGKPVAFWLNEASVGELADAISQYGEEMQSQRIARALVEARPLRTTRQLRKVLERNLRLKKRRLSIHPATRVFQALRIVVNDELVALECALPKAMRLLRAGGRLAVMSYHSLEDRIVKRNFKLASSDCLCPPEKLICDCAHTASVTLITRKPIRPSAKEVKSNPRSRSAKLRVVEAL